MGPGWREIPCLMLLLGVDCGGDRSLCVLTDARGNLLAEGHAPAPGESNLEEVLRAAVAPCLEVVGEGDATTVVAIPGLDQRQARMHALAVVRKVLPERLAVWLCSSLEAELAGSLGGRPGLLIHAGMRAAAAGLERSGRFWSTGESQEVLGDEGSSLWLASRTLQLAVRGMEGRMARSPRLERTLVAYFGVDDLNELLALLDRGHLTPGELAGSVSVILELAAYPGPDPACRALILKASRQLVQLTRQASGRGRWASAPTASWSGSALHGPLLEAFQTEVFKYLPEVRWRPPVFPTPGGCLLLALAAAAVGTHRGSGGLKPGLTSIPPGPGVRNVDQDVWREAFRLKEPLAQYRA
ncbi:MAG: hypothetical protein AMXMBFR33_36640 [Candidatus Xenobia bacterium]